MNDYFNRQSATQIKLLRDAYALRHKGWNNHEKQALFLAYTETLKGETIDKNKFDAVASYWGNDARMKAWDYSKNRSGFSLAPTKMMAHAAITKKSMQSSAPANEMVNFIEQHRQEMMRRMYADRLSNI